MLISHSLGGILIKQVIVNSRASERHRPICNSIFRQVLFGTPNSGPCDRTSLKFLQICAAIATRVQGKRKNDLMRVLDNESLFSDILQDGFRLHLGKYKIISCYEEFNSVHPKSPESKETWLIVFC